MNKSNTTSTPNQFFKNSSTRKEYYKTKNIKTIKHKDNNTKDIIHISGENTSELETPSETSVTPASLSTRGAKVSIKEFYEDEERVHDFYNKNVPELKEPDHLPFYVSVSIKGYKSMNSRREVNIDIIPYSAEKPIQLKSHTVHKTLKWELFRDLSNEEKIASAWCATSHFFDACDPEHNPMAGKIKFRRHYLTVPRGRISNASCLTEDHGSYVLVVLMFGKNVIEIQANKCNHPLFTYKGDWKNDAEQDGVLL